MQTYQISCINEDTIYLNTFHTKTSFFDNYFLASLWIMIFNSANIACLLLIEIGLGADAFIKKIIYNRGIVCIFFQSIRFGKVGSLHLDMTFINQEPSTIKRLQNLAYSLLRISHLVRSMRWL